MLKWTLISAIIAILDQITKYFASAHLEMFQPVAIAPALNFTLMHNTGAAFSFLSEAGGWQRWFFMILTIAVSILLIVWIKRLQAHERASAIALSMILGGAIGNVIDRIRLGYVVDFIDVYYEQMHWPAFNIADSAITVGAVTLVIISFMTKEEPPKANPSTKKKSAKTESLSN